MPYSKNSKAKDHGFLTFHVSNLAKWTYEGLLFPLREKLYPLLYYGHLMEMKSSNEFKEVRFKIRNDPFQMYHDMALYFFDTKVIDKPTIHEYARWCMKRVTDSNVVQMFQWKLDRSQQTQVQQNTMFGNQQEFKQVQQWPVS